MAQPIMHTIHFQCPGCGVVGVGVRPHGSEAHNLSDGFHAETRNDAQVVVCQCGKIVFPPEPSD